MATTSASGTEFSGDLPAALLDDGEELPPGIGPWKLAWRRLRRNKVALFFGGVFLRDRACCACWRRCTRTTSRTLGLADQNIDKPIHDRRQEDVRAQTRPASRSGRPGTASTSSAPTPTAATSRCGCSTAAATRSRSASIATVITMILAMILGVVGGLLPRHRRRRDHRGSSSTSIWAFPAVLLGIALGSDARGRRHRPRPLQINGNSLLVPAVVDRDRLHPVRGQAGPRPGADAARARVRRRRPAAGAQPQADHVHRGPAEPGIDDRRVRPADPRQRDPARGRLCRTSVRACSRRTRRGGR